MLKFEASREQRNALEWLVYWIANENYIRERYGNDAPEIKKCSDTITKCIFPELDRLQVPFWVQNSVISIGGNWRKYKECCFSSLCREKNIYI